MDWFTHLLISLLNKYNHFSTMFDVPIHRTSTLFLFDKCRCTMIKCISLVSASPSINLFCLHRKRRCKRHQLRWGMYSSLFSVEYNKAICYIIRVKRQLMMLRQKVCEESLALLWCKQKTAIPLASTGNFVIRKPWDNKSSE
jgi:hypothetical protein